MKCVFFIALFVFSAQEVLMYSGNTPRPCVSPSCSGEYLPVCGKQRVGDCWDVKIFRNDCGMAAENACGKANYVPCVENTCDAGEGHVLN